MYMIIGVSVCVGMMKSVSVEIGWIRIERRRKREVERGWNVIGLGVGGMLLVMVCLVECERNGG